MSIVPVEEGSFVCRHQLDYGHLILMVMAPVGTELGVFKSETRFFLFPLALLFSQKGLT